MQKSVLQRLIHGTLSYTKKQFRWAHTAERVQEPAASPLKGIEDRSLSSDHSDPLHFPHLAPWVMAGYLAVDLPTFYTYLYSPTVVRCGMWTGRAPSVP